MQDYINLNKFFYSYFRKKSYVNVFNVLQSFIILTTRLDFYLPIEFKKKVLLLYHSNQISSCLLKLRIRLVHCLTKRVQR